MTEGTQTVLASADYFILVLFRVLGLVFPSPFFGRINVPARVKTALTLALTLLFFWRFPEQAQAQYRTLLEYGLVCMREALLGLSLGFVTNLFVSLVFVAGQMIDMQIGFGIVNVYDLQNNTQIPMVGNLLNVMLILLFYLSNGHHRLIEILSASFARIPVGALAFPHQIGLVALELFAKAFLLGAQVALPAVASGLVLEFSFGMLIRTVPQMNMFVIGIPIKIAVGFLMLLLIVPMFASFSGTIFNQMFVGVEKMFMTFVPAP